MPDQTATDEPLPLPLAGVRVLDLGTFIAAPFAAGILGEFGAEVIKVEAPGIGDPLRSFGSPSRSSDSLCWLSEARNKKSITLDLRSKEGAEIAKRLICASDVVCENFRPGTLEKWGLGYDVLKVLHPRLVMLRISGFGQSGPYRDRPGFARIAHAFGGLAHLTGMPGGPPLTPGSTSLADYMTGLYGAVGILMALRSVDQTGLGQMIDLALYESIFRVLDDMAPTFAQSGLVRGRLGTGTTNACPHGHFETADNRWIALACSSDRIFARLAAIMNREDLRKRFPTTRQRLENRAEIDTAVTAWIKGQSAEQVVANCVAGEVPCSPINTIADLFADTHVMARQNIVTRAAPDGSPVAVPSTVPHLSATPGRIISLGPALGSANHDVYGKLLGLDDAELDRLARRKII